MNKICSLIIGGTKGMGRNLVDLLSNQGHQISVIAREVPPQNECSKNSVHYWPVDLLDHGKLLKTLSEIIRQNGKLNNLVFFQRYRNQENNWRGEIETSLTATKIAIEHLADDFEPQKASIVLVSSVNSHLISKDLPLSYHVAKSALVQMVRYYAVSLGPKGIRVNSVSPGTILKDETKNFFLSDQQLHNLYKNVVPLGRIGTASEVSEIIAFLLSSKASFLTGQDIIVDGGVSIQFQESLAMRLQAEGASDAP